MKQFLELIGALVNLRTILARLVVIVMRNAQDVLSLRSQNAKNVTTTTFPQWYNLLCSI